MRSRTLLGMATMLLAAFVFAVMYGCVRYLSTGVHPFEVVFFRNLFGLVVVVPWIARYGLAPLRTSRFGLHVTRAVANTLGMLLYFTAVSSIPLALVQALGFTAPLFTTLLATSLLGERVGPRRVTAVVVGFAGALIVVRPGLQTIDPGVVMTLCSAVTWAFCMIVIKKLARTDSAVTITAWMGLLMTPMSLVFAVFVWTWPTPVELAWLALTGILGGLGQVLLSQAFRLADASAVMPLDFTKIVWGAAIGWYAFGQVVDAWTWVGAVVIFSGATYLALRERRGEHGADARATA